MTTRKIFLFSSLLFSVLFSCNKENTQKETATDEKATGTEMPKTSNNPYDYAGELHNKTLDYVNSQALTREIPREELLQKMNSWVMQKPELKDYSNSSVSSNLPLNDANKYLSLAKKNVKTRPQCVRRQRQMPLVPLVLYCAIRCTRLFCWCGNWTYNIRR